MSEDAGRLVGGRYRLGEVLGRGGMGTVWRGEDEILGRRVAVKELRFPSSVDEEEKQRLITRTLREAKAIARIRSGSAITVFDVVNEDSRPWIVMELVEGRSLADKIKEDGPLDPQRTAEVGLAILDVLRAAHREGILHRDVKPSNVLLEDVTGRVVLTDFGIAKVEGDPSVTSTGMLVGAPSYISPERARGKPPGPPADLWSLGGLLFAAVEGRPPYDKGSAISTLTAVMTEPVPVSRNAGELSEVIAGLLVKDPEKRLDVDGARVLLEPVAFGMTSAPKGAGADGGSPNTRTSVLPAVPASSSGTGRGGAQGSGSGHGRRKRRSEGASSGERLRGALKSVRNAASAAGAGTAASGTGTGTGSDAGSGSGGVSGPGTRPGGARTGSGAGPSTPASAGPPPSAPPVPSSPPGRASGHPAPPTKPPSTPSFRKAGDSAPKHAGGQSGRRAAGQQPGAAPSASSAGGRRGSGAVGAQGPGASSGQEQGALPTSATGSGGRALPPESGGSGAINSLRDLRELPELRKGVPARMVAIGVAAVVAVIVIIVLIATAASGDDEDPGKDKGSSSADDGKGGAGAKGAQKESDTSDGAKDQGGEEKADDKPEEKKPAKPAKPAFPAGYAKVTDGRFHFAMALPEGWKRTGIAGQNSGGKYGASSGSLPKIQVDYNGSPSSDAAGAWRSLEPAVKKSSPGFRSLGIKEVGWRGYPTVADWQFTRQENGKKVRVLNRGFKADENSGYAIMITCKADGWQDKSCKTLRETAFKTFKPQG
ncbi:serine/threonine protein kinase [Streptomyces sp. NBC_01775]|uniref:serine/threonine-protein kinase n=1 Tax=Streptomyces sp. NBC_01775 TaxID=2975939 RepID=UPI002DDAC254|nr:serine/threonine-protein kinase [Streptomyces sp. NBC_01775]WSB77280.1 serine/threonine protein kinase [Streptomyces sp. NBC_01775]